MIQSEKMRSLGEMASGVAHDFNNSLTIILGNIKLLKEDIIDEMELLKNLMPLKKQPSRGQLQLQACRVSAAATDDYLTSSIELLALKPLIEEVRNLTRFSWKDLPQKEGYTIDLQRKLRLKIHLPFINGPDFKEMLTNLIFNAVDAMPSGGHIHLSVKQEEDKILLAVQDNGEGAVKRGCGTYI